LTGEIIAQVDPSPVEAFSMNGTKTKMAKQPELSRDWWIVSARGVPLGRLASQVAAVLRGKHKPTYTPHVDTGDFVIVTDAAEVVLTGDKLRQKMYYRASTRPGHLKQQSYEHFLAHSPEKVIRKAVKGMLPHNALGRQMLGKLKVYVGSEHPHEAQQAKALTVKARRH
jgi:large subunit ribosomal protein L13